LITDNLTDTLDKRKSGTCPLDSFGFLNMVHLVAPTDLAGTHIGTI
jgi:hypothetical protein